MLLPVVNKPQEIWRKGLYAILAAMFFLTLGTLSIITVIGPNLSGHLLFPMWFLAKSIEYQNYIQRSEGIIFFFWLTGIVLKTTLFYYLTCLATSKIFALKTYHRVVYFLAPVQVAAATFLFGNMLQFQEFLSKYWPPLALFFEIALPLLLLMAAVLRKKGNRRNPQ